MDDSELLSMIGAITNDDLAEEVILSALKIIKEDPELTIYEALYSAQMEWDV